VKQNPGQFKRWNPEIITTNFRPDLLAPRQLANVLKILLPEKQARKVLRRKARKVTA